MGAIGMAELGAEGMVEIGTAGVAGGMTIGIAVSTATSGLSKVFAIKRIDMQNE